MTRQSKGRTKPTLPSTAEPQPSKGPTTPNPVSRAVPSSQAMSLTTTKVPPPASLAESIHRPNPIPETTQLLETIKTLGELLDDLELTRIANGNRIAALEREHGESLPHLDVVQKQIRAAEHLAELELVRAWRKHRLAPWAKTFHGVGEKSIARLVAVIGEPGDRENVAKLWAYCGHGDPARKRRKGMTQEELFRLGSPAAKKQTWLIAAALLKSGVRTDEDGSKYALSPGGQMYLGRRAATIERVHASPCVRCGPSGHPAAAGSPWSDAHKHADALRFLGKQFLKELWIASRQSSNGFTVAAQ